MDDSFILNVVVNSLQRGDIRLIDLSQAIDSHAPTWEGTCGFYEDMLLNYGQDKFKVQRFHMLAGVGTHMDAPAHLFQGDQEIHEISLNQLIFPLAVVDVSSQVHHNPTYEVTLDDVRYNERLYGPIPENALLIIRTGWSTYWEDDQKYRNPDHHGIMRFPSMSPQIVSAYLSIISGIGVDTLSPDGGDVKKGFPVHEILLKHKKLIIENIHHNLTYLPPRGALGICLPLKITSATESPVRFIALINHANPSYIR